jgi:predicted nucleic acid-binding protein
LRPVFVNAGPLIALGKLNRLHLLTDLYESLQVPRAVYREVVVEGTAQGMPDALTVRLFLEVRGLPVVEASEETLRAYSSAVILGAGEMELLALACGFKDALVLLDDEEARVKRVDKGSLSRGRWESSSRLGAPSCSRSRRRRS